MPIVRELIEEFPDESARRVAKEALDKVNLHVAVCDLRNIEDDKWKRALETRVTDNFNAIHTRMWAFGGSVTAAAFTAILLLIGILFKR